MSLDPDNHKVLQATVQNALEQKAPIQIQGSGSKSFYGRSCRGQPLSLAGQRGDISYEPTELVITACAGTPLAEIEAILAEQGQMLAFEPPHFGPNATLGGTIACGLSGPRRPYAGAARDFVLGVQCLNGKGEILRFGGQVMKNVAGYDVSRLMCGALGTLGMLLEISLKVLPRPETEITLSFETEAAQALERMNTLAAEPLPLSAACFTGEQLYLRLSGTGAGVTAARRELGGEALDHGERFWEDLREQRLDFFAGDAPLWRLSVPPATEPLALLGDWLLDWGGAQRWLCAQETDAAEIRRAAATVGGHGMLFRGGDRTGEVFHPLPPALMALHRRLKHAFDPQGIFNPGRMYRNY